MKSVIPLIIILIIITNNINIRILIHNSILILFVVLEENLG